MANIVDEGDQGVVVSNRKTLIEILHETFDAYSIVGVKNVTTISLAIPWLPAKNEKVVTTPTYKNISGREELSEDGTMTIAGKRKILHINPDEVATISGEFAYVAIPYIINTQIQLEERKKSNKDKGDADETKVQVERELRKRQLLEEVFVGFPRESKNEPQK